MLAAQRALLSTFPPGWLWGQLFWFVNSMSSFQPSLGSWVAGSVQAEDKEGGLARNSEGFGT